MGVKIMTRNRGVKRVCICFIITILFANKNVAQNLDIDKNTNTFLKQKLIYKDFYQIDLDDLNNEGAIGELLMLGHEAATLDSSFYYIKKSLALSIKTKDSLLKPYILYHLGYTSFNLQKYKEAKFYFNKCLAISKPYKLNGMLYECYNLLGVIEKYNQNFDVALDYFNKAILNTDIVSDKVRIKINIASIYIDTDKLAFAKLILEEVFLFDKEHPNEIGDYWLTFAYINRSYLQEDFNQEIAMMQKALHHAELSEDNGLYIQTAYSLAEVFIINNKNSDGLNELNNVISLSKKYNLYDILNRAYISKSNLFTYQGQFKKSLLLLDSIQLTDNIISLQKDINELKYINYKNIDNYKNAVIYSDSIIKYLKETNTVKKQEASLKFAKKYETEKKEQENKLLKQEVEIQNLRNIKQKNKIIIYATLILIILFILFFIIYRFRKNQKAAILLKEKNTLILNQNEKLQISNSTKQKLFSIISHDLINPFNAILGYTELLDKDYDTFSACEKKEFISIIHKYATHNYNLTKNLLAWSRAQQNSIILKKEHLNVKEIVLDVTTSYEILAKKKNISCIVNIEDALTTFADKNCLRTILINLYSNAIKYSNKNKSICISAQKTIYKTTISVKDSGIGMTDYQLNNLFKISETISTKGTNNEKGTGFGLLICKELVELHNGTLHVKSMPNKETIITLFFLEEIMN